jgi:4-carboxymuconolactone decarboxylase
MTEKRFLSRTYFEMSRCYPEVMTAMTEMGKTIRNSGPLDEKTTHLIQLAAAAAANSEGAVHSHARRAHEAGATADEIYHTILLLIPTCGFPRAMAAASWCRDIIEGICGE